MLYPEIQNGHLLLMPQVDRRIARRVASALLAIEDDRDLIKSIKIHGFTIPLDYTPVEQLMRELRVLPFDASPQFTFWDIWQQNWLLILTVSASSLLIIIMALSAHFKNRQLLQAKRESEDYLAKLHLQEERLQQLYEYMNLGAVVYEAIDDG